MGPMVFFLFLTNLLTVTLQAEDVDRYLQFPAGFKLGTATASYQIEGAWNVSDKSLNIWDEFTHRNPSPILDGSDGDVACDSYNKYKEDLTILKDLGVESYRISLSWSRILPTGFGNKVSKDGIQYYKNLLDDLKALGIEPLVTLYHWDHPAVLEEMGGWTNEMMVTWFADYARIVFKELGHRVKIFATVNEPSVLCNYGYKEGIKAPGKKLELVGPYLCVHNIIKAHAKAYRIYDDEFRKIHGGQIGIVMSCPYYYSKHKNDTETAEIKFAFDCGWIANPIYSKMGDYPAIMKKRIGENSKLEGYPRSRLPEFTQSEIDNIRGTADYFGLNHYTTRLTEPSPKSNNTLWYEDTGVITGSDPSWLFAEISGIPIVPKGFGDLLRKIKLNYNNPVVYVTENGFPDGGSRLNDPERIEYFHNYIREMLLAVNRDGCNVQRYFAWSFLDNFEWERGYKVRYGLVNVDFEESQRPRTPKLSYNWYKELIRTRKLPPVDAFTDIIH